jgi:hypothetical protein
MKEISSASLSRLVTKALLLDIESSQKLLYQAIDFANSRDAHQVDKTNDDIATAFTLWAFSVETTYLYENIQDDGLRERLINESVSAFSESTNIPVDTVKSWIDRALLGKKLTYEKGVPSFIALPIMFHLGYGDLKKLELDLLSSLPATLYVEYLLAVTGKWKKALEIYTVS